MKCAIYARVSTGNQESDNQLLELRAFANSRGLEVAAEFVDVESGGKGEGSRPRLKAMLAAAHRHQFGVVLVWALDRLTREGTAKALHYLERLNAAHVGFLSLQEPHLDTTGAFGDILVAIFATFAKMERLRLSERTKAGLARVRASGKVLGRPEMSDGKRQQIIGLHENFGMGSRKIHAATGLPLGTIRAVLTSHRKQALLSVV